ncbi:hypothetical protein VPHG_00180 [Vibrio phage 11895-B1]|uniref:hypothetical protein n=1 Tax=Vibrio phage 11895-B1 TaxID=754075 RepID=UPI0002C11C6C|nr:hypothetical protein VPHG_00180 [Vibrio phage 11895-B1]AGH32243.1 hypothetical protein VPHG_00180 [Vibrio phage 11895-B1]
MTKPKYILSKEDSPLTEYAVIVVAEFNELTSSVGQVTYELSVTDDSRDATRFNWIEDALDMLDILDLKGWDVVPLEL